MSIHRRTKRAALIALAGGTAVALSACSTTADSADNSANAADSDTITAVATTTQICDYLTHIAEGGLTRKRRMPKERKPPPATVTPHWN